MEGQGQQSSRSSRSRGLSRSRGYPKGSEQWWYGRGGGRSRGRSRGSSSGGYLAKWLKVRTNTLKQNLQMEEQQWIVEHLHAYHSYTDVQQAQEEEAEQQAVPVNELANQDTMGQEVGSNRSPLTIRTLHFMPTMLKLRCSMLAMLQGC